MRRRFLGGPKAWPSTPEPPRNWGKPNPWRGASAPGGSSSLSALNCKVEVLELDPSILGREAPVDPTTRSVARRLPRRDLPLQRRLVGQPAVQALLGQHGKLDLGHVQPAAMLGRVMDLQPVGQPPGL